jgi:hydroxymethylglutaryl-CoA lyase
MQNSKRVLLHEVGMRDGLQIEKKVVPTDQKIRWLESILDSGVDIVQVGSFVNPEKVPQMADTDLLFSQIQSGRSKGPALSGLVLNEKGLDRALACGVELVCMGVSASDTHSRRNTGMSTDEAVRRIVPMAKRALAEGRKVQASVQSAFGCGFEGRIPVERVLDIAKAYVDAGVRTVSLADTAGHALPAQVGDLFGAVLALDPSLECACHFHDTYGLAMSNALAAMAAGVTFFELAFASLGGCPFTAATGGNLCTEDFAYYLYRAGIRTDIHLEPLLEVSNEASRFFGRSLPGAVYRIGPIKAMNR